MRIFLTFAALTSVFGRPILAPRFIAILIPARTRSLMSERSNSASAENLHREPSGRRAEIE